MPRANRFMQPGQIYHLTHRCHDGSFLFRFARDRSEYRERLRKATTHFNVSLLNYCITSNHSHVVAVECEPGNISRMMQKLEGEFAGYYNFRKHRRGSFWQDRFHCTMVEDGKHLQNCMIYVDLNMVRAGVVSHPEEWSWCGYSELVGEKNRYRLSDVEKLLQFINHHDRDIFREAYRRQIERAIAEQRLKREACWTESIAVGSESYVRKIAAALRNRRRRMMIQREDDGHWFVRESVAPHYQRHRTALVAHQ